MLLIAVVILAFNCICVTPQPQDPYLYHQHIYPPVQYEIVPAPPIGYTSQGPNVMSGLIQFLVAAAVINRILPGNNPGTTPAFSASLNTCGKTGSTGPTLAQCRSTYNTDWSNDPQRFSVVDGVQMLIIPSTGRYRFEAYGAEGGTGNTNGNAAGKGAKIISEFVLNKGTRLNIVVGQKGVDGTGVEPGGGGGGTFVYTGNIGESGLLVAAGGGGGGGESGTRAGFNGHGGVEAISHLGLSGHIGLGGTGGVRTSAGAGWGSDGGAHSVKVGFPGTRWNGGDINVAGVGDGGFGGGGSGVSTNGGGGGGGYTGGDGVVDSTPNGDRGGSGGGSFNGGTNQNNMSGINSGHGRFEIRRIGSS